MESSNEGKFTLEGDGGRNGLMTELHNGADLELRMRLIISKCFFFLRQSTIKKNQRVESG